MNGRGMFVGVAAAGVVLAVVWSHPSPAAWLARLGLAIGLYAIWWLGRPPGR